MEGRALSTHFRNVLFRGGLYRLRGPRCRPHQKKTPDRSIPLRNSKTVRISAIDQDTEQVVNEQLYPLVLVCTI